MNVTHKIYIDLTRRGNVPVIDVVQEEKNTRMIELGLREGFNLWYPPEDAVVLVRYQKADGTCGEYDTLPDGSKAYSISGNHVCVTLAPQMLTSEGGVDLCITLIWANKELTICQGRLKVSGKLPEPEASEDYFNITGFIPQPETAAVGRYLEISEVDENGKIRAVRAVEAPTGNSEVPENVVICDLNEATEDESIVPLNADTLGGFHPNAFLKSECRTTVLAPVLGITLAIRRMGPLVLVSWGGVSTESFAINTWKMIANVGTLPTNNVNHMWMLYTTDVDTSYRYCISVDSGAFQINARSGSIPSGKTFRGFFAYFTDDPFEEATA